MVLRYYGAMGLRNASFRYGAGMIFYGIYIRDRISVYLFELPSEEFLGNEMPRE
jgi:hypothetical protein